MRKICSPVALAAASVLAITAAVLAPWSSAEASPGTSVALSCSALDDPITQVVNPGNGATLLTPWASEAAGAAKYGFTQDNGALFLASTTPQPGLVPVTRLYRGGVLQDFLFTSDSAEVEAAGKTFAYKDEGIRFYVSVTRADCLVPVWRLRKGNKHRLTVETADKAALMSSGWTYESVAFYAAPTASTVAPTPDPTPTPAPTTASPSPTPFTITTSPAGAQAFTFAVIPDTQLEVTRAGDPRMTNRTQWLAEQDIAFAAQTGDLLNWDTPDHAQAKVAKAGLDVLHADGIPYTFAIGNHDTEATGVGGSARDNSRTRQLQRDTSTVNSIWTADDFGNVGGAYESGKIDNVYATYTAGGLKWMVVSLEFCARPGAVAWAKQVIADHPDYNVIISTHSYETGSGDIDPSNQGYGDTSGQQLFDQVISQYANVKLVFSGHVGVAAKARVDTGVHGNKIYSFLTTMHDDSTNPVRMVEVDPAAGTIETSIYAPYTDRTWPEYTETVRGLTFVR